MSLPKPYYEDEAVSLYHADCRDLVDEIALWAHAAITDPPYGYGKYLTDKPFDPALLKKWCGRHRTVAVFGYPEQAVEWCVASRCLPAEWITWWPTNLASARTKGLSRECEVVAVFGLAVGAASLLRERSTKEVGRAIAQLRGNDGELCRMGDVWRDPSPGAGFNRHQRLHPNQKPLSLMSKLVLLCSDLGETVFDPFAGSGTTLLAAKNLGRRAVGVEVDERHCEIAAKRLAQEVLPLEVS